MKDLSKEDQGNFQKTLRINALLEISKALSSSLDIKMSLNNVMNTLALCLTMSQGSLILLDSETKELIMEVVYGPDKQGIKERDIQKKVIESGLPVVVSSFGSPPLFLDSSKIPDIKKQDISYLSVPMKNEDKVVGVLTVDRLFNDSVAFGDDLILLNSITSIIAQTIKICNTVEKEREDLIRENKHLRHELEKLKGVSGHELKTNPQKQFSIEKVLEKKLDEIITVLDVKTEGKRRLYDDIIFIVEKILIKLALNRTKNIKYEAARFLGINRNTLHKKMNDLNISV